MSPDIRVMRTFARLLERCPRHVSLAAARWMWQVANDPKTTTKDELDEQARLREEEEAAIRSLIPPQEK